jgi:hypothetical protein
MTSAREIALDLLKRLLAGERGEVPLHLAMLLEKSSPLGTPDDHYRQILPPELVGLRLSSDTTEEIIATLCAEVSRNPDEALNISNFLHWIGFGHQDGRKNSDKPATSTYDG